MIKVVTKQKIQKDDVIVLIRKGEIMEEASHWSLKNLIITLNTANQYVTVALYYYNQEGVYNQIQEGMHSIAKLRKTKLSQGKASYQYNAGGKGGKGGEGAIVYPGYYYITMEVAA
ncbi:MAG: hypothetical protein EZS28_003990 [Streblomastix strix]|uniref:Uncharacterized protein n=1 Tax=Streblomastix strix TaxID=222440 RepID=A0A5J4X1H9_9EUKA|nr:MAG: hypothetical protein EZS28_003990 [Streblomastix strix]